MILCTYQGKCVNPVAVESERDLLLGSRSSKLLARNKMAAVEHGCVRNNKISRDFSFLYAGYAHIYTRPPPPKKKYRALTLYVFCYLDFIWKV